MAREGDRLVLLAEAAGRGSRPALDALLEALDASVRSVVRNILGSASGDSEDAVRDALALVREALPRIDPSDVEAEAIKFGREAAIARLMRGWSNRAEA